MKPTQLLQFRSESGATVRTIGRFDADQTVVLALSREQAEMVDNRIHTALWDDMIAGHMIEPARDILDQIAHERGELGPRE